MTLDDWMNSQRGWALQLLHDNDFDLLTRAKEFGVTAQTLKQKLANKLLTDKLNPGAENIP